LVFNLAEDVAEYAAQWARPALRLQIAPNLIFAQEAGVVRPLEAVTRWAAANRAEALIANRFTVGSVVVAVVVRMYLPRIDTAAKHNHIVVISRLRSSIIFVPRGTSYLRHVVIVSLTKGHGRCP
jgi:hypothetical protein